MEHIEGVTSIKRNGAHGQTGPRSIAGKHRSRWNALKDGATAKSPLLPFEDERIYKRHIKEVESALKPGNYVETQLVREYAEGLWRICRHEKRGAYEREAIMGRITPEMVAGMLQLDERYIPSAPDYITNLKYKISLQESAQAKRCLLLYRHLLENAKGIANYHMVWRQYKELFEAFATWAPLRWPNITPVINGAVDGLSLPWQKNPQKFLELLDKFSDHLFYVAHFESFKAEIRAWMEAWFFAQKSEMRRLEHDDQMLLKERNHVHNILDKIARLRKSNLYLEELPSRLSLRVDSAQKENS
jgi:hypothetical protein